jgi:hypothetical protein
VGSQAPAFMPGFSLVRSASDATGNLFSTRFLAPGNFGRSSAFALTLHLPVDLMPAAAPIGPWFEGSDLPQWTLRRPPLALLGSSTNQIAFGRERFKSLQFCLKVSQGALGIAKGLIPLIYFSENIVIR